MKNLKLKIYGRVQGVGFRWSAYEKFVELGLVGKAENGPEGTVTILVSGEEAALQKFTEWAKQGPSGAKVSNVEVAETEEKVEPVGHQQNKTKPIEKEE